LPENDPNIPKPFSLKRFLILLIIVLLPVVIWMVYRALERSRGGNHANALTPLAFQPLPLGSIKPQGWLLEQLQLQAGGLTGHLDEFWPDVQESGWIGGMAEGWERAPYWLDGLVPMAYLTNDARLKDKVKRWMDYILQHQLPDGWLGPEQSQPVAGTNYPPPAPRDPWPQFIILKVMTQYAEATGDPRVIPAMQKSLRGLGKQLDVKPLFGWNFFRWQDLLVSLFWLYDRTGESWLLDLARKVAGQGYDWPRHFSDLPVKEKSTKWNWQGHVVNNAMGLKTSALLYRLTGQEGFKNLSLQALEELDRWHGEANGLMSGDECLAGKSPSQGTELCAIVETMFSLETSFSVTGEVELADRLEKIAFNALPAAFAPDYWTHQYVEQANQVACQFVREPLFATVDGEGNLFGLQPNYGCCTANMHQGWPKLASHLWMTTPDHGLAAVVYAPSVVETVISGTKVRVELDTDYPFSDQLIFKVKADQPTEFPLYLRVPQWAKDATLKLPDGSPLPLTPGGFQKISRRWSGEETLLLKLPMTFRLRNGFQNSVSVERGPLIFSLGIKEEWKPFQPFRFQPVGLHKDDMELFPQSPWNYALVMDRNHPEKSLKFKNGEFKGNPFTLKGAPVQVVVSGKRLPSWGVKQGGAMPPPHSPVASGESEEELRLVPYGSTRLRVTEFPVLK
jgi:hypothetical protein